MQHSATGSRDDEYCARGGPTDGGRRIWRENAAVWTPAVGSPEAQRCSSGVANPRDRIFFYHRAMNSWIAVILCVAVAAISGVFTYLFTRLRIAKVSAQQARALGEAVTALENEKEKYEQAAKGIAENARPY